MKKNKLVHNARECERILNKNDCKHRNGHGSHRVAHLPDGSSLPYPDHGEWGVGLSVKITKALIAAGIVLIMICMLLSLYGNIVYAAQ